jgi:hypothetical protein
MRSSQLHDGPYKSPYMSNSIPSNIYPSHRYGKVFYPRSGYVELAVGTVSLWQVSSEYFGFPWQFSFHQLLHIH